MVPGAPAAAPAARGSAPLLGPRNKTSQSARPGCITFKLTGHFWHLGWIIIKVRSQKQGALRCTLLGGTRRGIEPAHELTHAAMPVMLWDSRRPVNEFENGFILDCACPIIQAVGLEVEEIMAGIIKETAAHNPHALRFVVVVGGSALAANR